MPNLKIKTNNGFIQELRVQELIEVDGRPFNSLVEVDRSNHEDRIRSLERVMTNVTAFLDEKFDLTPSPQEAQKQLTFPLDT